MEEILKLWTRSVPYCEEGDGVQKEHFIASDDPVQRLTDVSVPEISAFPVCSWKKVPAVLVCPGGGYNFLAWNHEGRDICSLLNGMGFAAFLLKYRCPDRRVAAFADAARAMRLIRANAARWNVDPEKVGALGFSAGAHLCAMLAASKNEVPYPPEDPTDTLAFRPDFTLLIYPARLADDDLKLSEEFAITRNMPPTFLLQVENDGVRVENSLGWFLAMKRVGAPAEMHLYAEGGHGFGIIRSGAAIADWPQLAASWLRRITGMC